MTRPDRLLDAFDTTPIVAIVRARSPIDLDAILARLADGGVTVAEVTVPTPGALAAIAKARAEGRLVVGAGTVLSIADADAAVGAGAQFLVTPNVDAAVIARAGELGVPILPGAFTPTEIALAAALGAAAVKVFPAARLGPSYLYDLSGPLPGISLVPTGGIGLGDVAGYLEAGALALGLGDPLLGDAVTGGSADDLVARTARFVETARSARRR
jgi:2-dehydro-3-deoxyphosphogluconate aldolase/(4S)-4-hydroxy-2-oxoglutarate aldolase